MAPEQEQVAHAGVVRFFPPTVSKLICKLGEFLVQRNYAFLPLAEIQRRRDWVFQMFGKNDAVFVRPDDNAKSFGGGIVQQQTFEEWYKLANFYNPGSDCLAVVSSPELFHAEWRFVIGQKQVITGSQYRRNGKVKFSSTFPPEAALIAKAVANTNGFEPHPIYIMDVANTCSGYRLIEIGSVSCASLYACDPKKIIDAVCEAI